MFYKKIITYLALINLLFLPMNAMANEKAEKKEEKAVTESTILLIASAYTGISFAEDCSQPSALVFAAGALYYVYGEIKNWNNFKKASDEVVKRYQMLNKEQTEAQVEALSKAEEQTRKAENAARERAKNATPAATIFTAAAVIAIIEFVLSFYTYDDTCQIENKWPELFKPLLNLMGNEAFAQADANKARAMGIVSPEAIIRLTTAISAAYTSINAARSSGGVRAVFFGAYALIASQVAKMTEDAADEYKKQADKYKAELQRLLNSLSKIGYIKYNKMNLALGELREIDAKRVTTQKFNCANSRGTNSFVMDSSCQCRAAGTCKRVSMPDLKYSGFNAPKPVTDSITSFSTMADNGYRSNNAEADLAQASLNSNSNALRNLKNKLQDGASKSLVKNGQAPIDFKEQEKIMAKNIIALVKSNLNQKAFDLFATNAGNTPTTKTSRKKGSDKKSDKNIKKQIRSLSKPIKFKSKGSKKPIDDFFALVEAENQEKLDTATELAKYKDNDEEIEKDKRKSIFKIITNRYIKSAFPVLFDEEK
ncbi:MAG: hypothetical protein CME70_19655 [Halobacteriovorax sp.]|nr:hypothetical protein [Halobacteriovorax sp.]